MKKDEHISRQEAIDAIMGQPPEPHYPSWYARVIEEMPAAEWPKTGKWIDGQCSICGCDIPAYIIDWKWQKDMDANFCPNCGAKMVEQQEPEG